MGIRLQCRAHGHLCLRATQSEWGVKGPLEEVGHLVERDERIVYSCAPEGPGAQREPWAKGLLLGWWTHMGARPHLHPCWVAENTQTF